MDARWEKILIERGRIHPEVKALEQRLRIRQARGGRIKYRRPRDLLIQPRNPTEATAQQDLSLVTKIAEQAKLLQGVAATKRITRKITSIHEAYLRRQIKRIKELTGW